MGAREGKLIKWVKRLGSQRCKGAMVAPHQPPLVHHPPKAAAVLLPAQVAGIEHGQPAVRKIVRLSAAGTVTALERAPWGGGGAGALPGAQGGGGSVAGIAAARQRHAGPQQATRISVSRAASKRPACWPAEQVRTWGGRSGPTRISELPPAPVVTCTVAAGSSHTVTGSPVAPPSALPPLTPLLALPLLPLPVPVPLPAGGKAVRLKVGK